MHENLGSLGNGHCTERSYRIVNILKRNDLKESVVAYRKKEMKHKEQVLGIVSAQKPDVRSTTISKAKRPAPSMLLVVVAVAVIFFF
jgi:hypothetical protein